jgi:hypothetical protein
VKTRLVILLFALATTVAFVYVRWEHVPIEVETSNFLSIESIHDEAARRVRSRHVNAIEAERQIQEVEAIVRINRLVRSLCIRDWRDHRIDFLNNSEVCALQMILSRMAETDQSVQPLAALPNDLRIRLTRRRDGFVNVRISRENGTGVVISCAPE